MTYDIHCMQFLTDYSINMITPITCTSSRSTSVIINSLVTNIILPSILDVTIIFYRINQDQYPAFQLTIKIKFTAGFSVIQNSLSMLCFCMCIYFPYLL